VVLRARCFPGATLLLVREARASQACDNVRGAPDAFRLRVRNVAPQPRSDNALGPLFVLLTAGVPTTGDARVPLARRILIAKTRTAIDAAIEGADLALVLPLCCLPGRRAC
jgi:hypothetical protein